MLGPAFWNLYSGFEFFLNWKASQGIFFSRKLQPFIRQPISSSLSILKKKKKRYDRSIWIVGWFEFVKNLALLTANRVFLVTTACTCRRLRRWPWRFFPRIVRRVLNLLWRNLDSSQNASSRIWQSGDDSLRKLCKLSRRCFQDLRSRITLCDSSL